MDEYYNSWEKIISSGCKADLFSTWKSFSCGKIDLKYIFKQVCIWFYIDLITKYFINERTEQLQSKY